ncbi:MAG: hypothetical protein KDB40_00880 [Acidimicrobiales bacterium]|nr:hypothetical protein [Acidimicrobiales bacterium]MCB9395048.1 hypothetical protein [Acidimicrobiaceae bacterium]
MIRSNTRKFTVVAFAALALVAGACGGDDEGGSGDQGAVVDKMMEVADEAGFELDRDCVADLVGQLSDADLELLAEADIDDDVELSPEGDALGEQMFTCVPQDALVEQIMTQVGGQEGVDDECLREVLEGMSNDDMQAIASGDSSSEAFTQMMTDILPCMELGG